MKFSLLFILFGLFCVSELWAEPGKVIVRGAKENVCIYNSIRARERRVFVPEKNMKETVVLLPEKECGDLFYLISGSETSWIRVLPDETVTVDVRKKPWKFSGDAKAMNRYLYVWTQKMFFGKPNALTYRIEMMFHQLPDREKRVPDPKAFYTKEYIEWVNHIGMESLDDLAKANLKDDLFVKEQEKRIYYSWLEMQLQNYQIAKEKVEIPAESFTFLQEMKFENAAFMKYPGLDDVLRIYYDMADARGLIKYDNNNFLRRRAEMIVNAEIRDYYILQELETIIRNEWLYQLDQVFASVEDMMMTKEGKAKLTEYKKRYQDLLASDANQQGKKAVNISFKDVNDKELGLHMFKGKYILVDVWATWCGPCKYEIPHLTRLEEELKGRDVVFVSLSADKPEDTQKWKDMVREFGMKGICGIAPDAFNHPFFEKYKVKSIPRFIVIDPEGNIVMTKARRPSDPVLKMQLDELLKRYEQEKTTINGVVAGADGSSVYVSERRGMMSAALAETVVRDGKFDVSFVIDKPGFLMFSCQNVYAGMVWVNPKDRIIFNPGQSSLFTGGDAEVNNIIATLNTKYAGRWPKYAEKEVLDLERGRLLKGIYDDIEKDIESTMLPLEKKRLLIGYFQSDLLNKMYGRIAISKVIGKGLARPIVKPGYSVPVVDMELLPELTCYPAWMDGVQELLYARLTAGKIKIQSAETYLADMAKGLRDETLREAYIMYQLDMDILRGNLVGIRERVESVRPMIKQPENLKLLAEMSGRIEKAEQRYQIVLPGTDLSGYSFENDKGKMVSLSDFKGKYIFIDMWSTGCNPCVGEIPYIKEMEHGFAGKPIAWVSISTDMKKTVWLDFLKTNNMHGVQLICNDGFKDPFIKQIALGGIPHFLLLDKEGKVLDYHTLRPSNPVLGELLKMVLNKK